MFNKLLVMLAAFSLTFIGCDDDDKKEPAQDCVVRDAEVAGEEPCEGDDCEPEAGVEVPVAGEETPCEGEDCPDCEDEDCEPEPVPAGEEPCEGDDCEPEPAPAGTESTETAGEEVPSAGEETPEAGTESTPAGEESPDEGGSDEAGTEVIPG